MLPSIAGLFAKTIGQDQSQQIDRVADLARTHKGFRLARGRVERLRAAKPGDDIRPVFIQQ